MRSRATLALLALVLPVALGVAAGCSRTPAPAPAQSPAQAPVVSAMAAAQKRSEIATSFPVQVPVAQGEVARGQAQSASVWDYELAVAAPRESVAAWYRSAYGAAEWKVVGESTSADGVLRIQLMKGFAETQLDLAEEGGSTRVRAIVGLSEPVFDTQ